MVKIKFSPLKTNIILLIIKDSSMAEVLDNLRLYIRVTTDQAFYILDYMIEKELIIFEKGELQLTGNAHQLLMESGLNTVNFFKLSDSSFSVNEKYLTDFVPNRL